MTDTTQHVPTRAELVAFCQEVWRITNEHEEAHGRGANEYELTRIRKSHDASARLWVVDFQYHYQLLGSRRTVYMYYIITVAPHSGKLLFVRLDEVKEEQSQ